MNEINLFLENLFFIPPIWPNLDMLYYVSCWCWINREWYFSSFQQWKVGCGDWRLTFTAFPAKRSGQVVWTHPQKSKLVSRESKKSYFFFNHSKESLPYCLPFRCSCRRVFIVFRARSHLWWADILTFTIMMVA